MNILDDKKPNKKIKFDIWGLALFSIIMIPNLIWAAIPAPNDILRAESVTPIVDMFASVFQVILVAALCITMQGKQKTPVGKQFLLGIILAILVYFSGWVWYYKGTVNQVTILILCVAPCLAFIFFSVARKNKVALIAAILFMICHLIFSIGNFMI